jgi:hypothetical protein
LMPSDWCVHACTQGRRIAYVDVRTRVEKNLDASYARLLVVLLCRSNVQWCAPWFEKEQGERGKALEGASLTLELLVVEVNVCTVAKERKDLFWASIHNGFA